MDFPFEVRCMFLAIISILVTASDADNKLLVVTFSRKESSGLRKFQNSAQYYGLNLKILGREAETNGEGLRVIYLREELEKYKDDPEQIILYVNGGDGFINGPAEQILNKFRKFNANVVFSAEKSCWPNWSLSYRYPQVSGAQKYLNSGMFIGYAPELYRIVHSGPINEFDNDQLFYTNVFLNEDQRKALNIQLDYQSEMFQNLFGSLEELDLLFEDKGAYIYNNAYDTRPLVFHANGRTNAFLDTMGNYLAGGWNPDDSCVRCLQHTQNLGQLDVQNYPTVVMAVFIEESTPDLLAFFIKLHQLDYPKDRIHMFVHNAEEYHNDLVASFLREHGDEYASIKFLSESKVQEWRIRHMAIEECVVRKCDFYFSVDSDVHLENSQTLRLLIEQNRSVVAPMLARSGNPSDVNFWSSIMPNGQRSESMDFTNIVENHRRGLWNVPCVESCYLIRGDIILDLKTRPSYIQVAKLAFCTGMRHRNVDMYVSNRETWGHLTSSDHFDPSEISELHTTIEQEDSKYIDEHQLLILVLVLFALVLMFMTHRIIRRHLLCNSRLMRIFFIRNVSKIWSPPL